MIKLRHERRPKFNEGTWRVAMKLNKGGYAVLWFMEDIHAVRAAVAEFRCSSGGISTLSIASWYDSLEVYEFMVNYSKMHHFFSSWLIHSDYPYCVGVSISTNICISSLIAHENRKS